MLSEAIGNGLYLSKDRSRVRATPEVETKAITASSYAEAYQIAFGAPSPFIGRDKAMHEKLAIEQAGYIATIVLQ